MRCQSGQETCEEISRIRPGVKVIFRSGYTEGVVDEQAIRERGPTLMLKPVSPRQLVKKVREVLDR